jgi:hypothetical protein
MFEQQRFRGDGANATRANQLRQSDQKMDGADDEFTHGGTLPRCPGRARVSRIYANAGLMRIRHPLAPLERGGRLTRSVERHDRDGPR